jgi:ankyrin repeat protein
MPEVIIQHEILIFLNFKDSMNFRKTAKSFNESYLYQHDPRLDDQFAIIEASSKGENNAVICLLKVPFVDPGIFNNSALLGAVYAGHSEVVKTLLESNRLDTTINGNIALITAVRIGH